MHLTDVTSIEFKVYILSFALPGYWVTTYFMHSLGIEAMTLMLLASKLHFNLQECFTLTGIKLLH